MSRLALIFDLDDTLIQSFRGYVELHHRVAKSLGWRLPTEDELANYGPTWEASVERMWPNVDLKPFYDLFEEILEEVVYPPVEGALATLQAFREAGHSMFIVTKRSSARLDYRLEQAGLDKNWFDGIYPADYSPTPKPDPRCFDPIWEILDWKPGDSQDPRAIYVGDRKEDQLAAENAGIPFVAVLSGPESKRGFPKAGTEFVIDSVADLSGVLAQSGLKGVRE